MIRVLVVEDSPTARELLLAILGEDPEISVVGVARDGLEALEMVEKTRPDVITMDIHMPNMDGFQASRRIMETRPTPIVIVSGSTTTDEVTKALRALEAGALTVLQRPPGPFDPRWEELVREIVQTVKWMAGVKVVRRWSRPPQPVAPIPPVVTLRPAGGVELVVIGASTGGPPVLKTILSALPPSFPFRVMVVQHLAEGFIGGFVKWLAAECAAPVQLAQDGEPVLPGHVYVAPDGRHMRYNRNGTVSLTDDPPENGLRPSVAHLFRSAREALGSRVVGILLTGMGSDGAQELKLLRNAGAITIAQDAASSAVHGMPGKAIELGGAQYVWPPEKIAEALKALAQSPQGQAGSLRGRGDRGKMGRSEEKLP
ncbi:MAG: chemotaxis-specific protein-glutamate methyltransferase CheB [Acidobacteriota bacterium]